MSRQTAAQEFGPVPDSDVGPVGSPGRSWCCPAGSPQWLRQDLPQSAQLRGRLQVVGAETAEPAGYYGHPEAVDEQENRQVDMNFTTVTIKVNLTLQSLKLKD